MTCASPPDCTCPRRDRPARGATGAGSVAVVLPLGPAPRDRPSRLRRDGAVSTSACLPVTVPKTSAWASSRRSARSGSRDPTEVAASTPRPVDCSRPSRCPAPVTSATSPRARVRYGSTTPVRRRSRGSTPLATPSSRLSRAGLRPRRRRSGLRRREALGLSGLRRTTIPRRRRLDRPRHESGRGDAEASPGPSPSWPGRSRVRVRRGSDLVRVDTATTDVTIVRHDVKALLAVAEPASLGFSPRTASSRPTS